MSDTKTTIKSLALKHITLDPRCQMRPDLDQDHIDTMSEVLMEGKELSGDLPVVYCDGHTNYLSDGFHRHPAHEQAGRKKMKCEIRQGTLRDATRHSLIANATHGKNRSLATKTKAVITALQDEEWGKFSQVKIAELCGVNQSTVSRVLKDNPSLMHTHKSNGPTIGKDGRAIDTTNIGKAKTSVDSATAGGPFDSDSENPEIDAETEIDYAALIPRSSPKLINSLGETVIGNTTFANKHPESPSPSAETEPADTDDSEDLREPDEGDGYTGPMEPVKVLRDAKGRICFSEKSKAAFARLPAIRAVMRTIDETIDDVNAIAKTPGGECLNLTSIAAHFKNARTAVRDARPFVVCPIHDNTLPPHLHDEKNCGVCSGRGWVSARAYANFNEDQKDLSEKWGAWDKGKAEVETE